MRNVKKHEKIFKTVRGGGGGAEPNPGLKKKTLSRFYPKAEKGEESWENLDGGLTAGAQGFVERLRQRNPVREPPKLRHQLKKTAQRGRSRIWTRLFGGGRKERSSGSIHISPP